METATDTIGRARRIGNSVRSLGCLLISRLGSHDTGNTPEEYHPPRPNLATFVLETAEGPRYDLKDSITEAELLKDADELFRE